MSQEWNEKVNSEMSKELQESMEESMATFTNDSALMIAHERALETEKGETALIQDPYARLLAGKKGPDLSDKFGQACGQFQFEDWPEFHKQWTVVRSKFIDDKINTLATSGCGLQMVNLGAGLDTRVFRLDSYQHLTTSYEVDMESINVLKKDILKKLDATVRCPQVLVTADLLNEGSLADGLAQAGFDTSKPAIFLAEGLIQYLPGKEQEFLKSVSELASAGSTLVLQFLEHEMILSQAKLRELLEPAGWSAFQFNQFGDDVLNYGRYKEGFPPNRMFSFLVCTKV